VKPDLTTIKGRDPVVATKRRAMTAARKRRISDRDSYVCRGGVAYQIDSKGRARSSNKCRVDFDHEIALELGGPDEDFNVTPRCNGCACPFDHKIKTANDARLIARANRLRDKAERQRKKRESQRGRKLPGKGQGRKLSGGGKLQGGGFPKTKRPLAGGKGSNWPGRPICRRG